MATGASGGASRRDIYHRRGDDLWLCSIAATHTRELPKLTENQTFAGPMEEGIGVIAYGEERPEHDIPDNSGKVSEAA